MNQWINRWINKWTCSDSFECFNDLMYLMCLVLLFHPTFQLNTWLYTFKSFLSFFLISLIRRVKLSCQNISLFWPKWFLFIACHVIKMQEMCFCFSFSGLSFPTYLISLAPPLSHPHPCTPIHCFFFLFFFPRLNFSPSFHRDPSNKDIMVKVRHSYTQASVSRECLDLYSV